MLVINNVKFARNEKEFTNSLFDKTGTCYGYYKKLKGRVHLTDQHKNIFAAIVVNNHGFKAIVNAVRMHNKVFYQHGCSDRTNKLLAVPESYLASRDYAENIFNSVS